MPRWLRTATFFVLMIFLLGLVLLCYYHPPSNWEPPALLLQSKLARRFLAINDVVVDIPEPDIHTLRGYLARHEPGPLHDGPITFEQNDEHTGLKGKEWRDGILVNVNQ